MANNQLPGVPGGTGTTGRRDLHAAAATAVRNGR